MKMRLVKLLTLLLFTVPIYAKDRPNVILFLVDDMGLMDTSVPFIIDASGKPKTYPLNSFYKTPNMEKLANQGVRFTNFYAHSVCSPTRTTLMTGQNSARHGVTNYIKPESNNRGAYGPKDWNWTGIKKNTLTLPKLLKDNGYQTIHVGKAHFAPIGYEGEDPCNIGFNVNIGGSAIGQPGSYYGKDGYGNIAGNKKRAVQGLEAYYKDDIFLTEALTIEANKQISKAVDKEKPFFLYMAHYAVHAPFHTDPRFIDHYNNSDKSKRAKAYATLIEGIDKSLGDIIHHVNELGIGENTLIIFMGDNGSDAPLPIKKNYSSSSPIKGKKGNNWEGGMRVPFIASWVKPSSQKTLQQDTPVKKDAIQKQMGTAMDILPTICSITNTKIPKEMTIDGFSLELQFDGKRNRHRNEIFLNHFPHKHRSSYFTSMVKYPWKVIYHYPVEKAASYELYNLKEDPFETSNLASENTKQLHKMMKSLDRELIKEHALYPKKDGQLLKPII
ncbi:sulfatase-like hydrolase/transferase [Halosquirtibacter xylanolyticus]|uniref:sulfatase-like hydrolase/transferase n=1 Tax=Halosquirtibacter xylanolyticus TaxID=3374599 RepID=UPI00374A5083|nr:sulfatase-like hydrolase/transferase [Prolixibacteraceae bacterium]